MSQRNVRVNELLKREISEVLHTRYQQESVRITVTEVRASPDHRKAMVFFSVLGDETESHAAGRFLRNNSRAIRHLVGQRIILKHLPHLQFKYDPSLARGTNVLQILDELEEGPADLDEDERS